MVAIVRDFETRDFVERRKTLRNTLDTSKPRRIIRSMKSIIVAGLGTLVLGCSPAADSTQPPKDRATQNRELREMTVAVGSPLVGRYQLVQRDSMLIMVDTAKGMTWALAPGITNAWVKLPSLPE